MKTNCSNCQQEITNIIYIDGLPYGTTCAERKLGKKLPLNFTGDYNKHVLDVSKIQEKLIAERAEAEKKVFELWDDAVMLSDSWFSANDWKKEFLLSICIQLNIRGLLNCLNLKQFEGPEEYLKSEYVKQYGLFANKYSKGIKTLSLKQQSILNR